jgi:DNA modification methylase
VDTRVIYCGDNLEQLEKLPDACVDLIYIDPPFNSNRNYEVFWGETKEMRAFEDRHESTQAYIEFMRPRCVDLARVLKDTGSFYYHCDWHANHYVKVMLDQIFGENNFVNEIIWKRQSSHNDAKQGSKHLGRVHDTLFLYGGSKEYYFKHLYRPYDPDYTEQFYRYTEAETGRKYRLGDLTAPGGASPSKGNPHYEFLGVTRYWRYSQENMEELHKQGRIIQTKPGTVPAYKRYLDEGKGVPLGSVWDDIGLVQGAAGERLGYPTQKPLKLLERIVEISSQPNDIVLDAFCGCGTALVAAQNLGRQWIGIDQSPTSCRSWQSGSGTSADFPKMKSYGEAGAASSCVICPGPKSSSAIFHRLNLRIGPLSLWAESRTRRKLGTWALMGAFIRLVQRRKRVTRTRRNLISWMTGIRFRLSRWTAWAART